MIDADRKKQEQSGAPEDEISQEELEAERAGASPGRPPRGRLIQTQAGAPISS